MYTHFSCSPIHATCSVHDFLLFTLLKTILLPSSPCSSHTISANYLFWPEDCNCLCSSFSYMKAHLKVPGLAARTENSK
jgi:hypothetical protein